MIKRERFYITLNNSILCMLNNYFVYFANYIRINFMEQLLSRKNYDLLILIHMFL